MQHARRNLTGLALSAACVLVLCTAAPSQARDANIHEAASEGELPALQRLLAADPKLANARHRSGSTPLLIVIISQHWGLNKARAVELLVANGADVNAAVKRGPWSYTPLYAACEEKCDREVVELLLAKGADPNAKAEEGELPLHPAVRARRTDLAEALLAKGADVNAQNDADGLTPLHYAAYNRDKAMATLLMKHGAKLDTKARNGKTPLDAAGSPAMADFLRGLAGGQKGGAGEALHDAAREDDVAAALLLLAKDANINALNPRGQTPLHLAVERGHKDMVTFLLTNKANPNVQDKGGQAPLHLAFAGWSKAASDLANMAHGQYLEDPAVPEGTPEATRRHAELKQAATESRNAYAAIVGLLILEHNANPFLKDGRGNPTWEAAAHIAGQGYDPDLTRLVRYFGVYLREFKGKLDIPTPKGR